MISPDFEEATPHLVYLERTSKYDNRLLQISQGNEACAVRPEKYSVCHIQIYIVIREKYRRPIHPELEMDTQALFRWHSLPFNGDYKKSTVTTLW